MKELLEVLSPDILTCVLIILMEFIMEIFLLLYLISFLAIQIWLSWKMAASLKTKQPRQICQSYSGKINLQ